jgi:hypothetical protein
MVTPGWSGAEHLPLRLSSGQWGPVDAMVESTSQMTVKVALPHLTKDVIRVM